jgi:Disulphide bond corrector protein DsbC
MRILFLCMAVVLGTQSAAPLPVETPHLTITTAPIASAAPPGKRLELTVDIAPKPRMHVYSPQQKDYIPIALTLQAAPAFSIQPAVYPKPEKYVFAPLKETQLVYSKPFRITQPVTIADAPALRAAGLLPGAALTITGKLRYQACDDAICYMPKEVPVSWRVTLGAASKD